MLNVIIPITLGWEYFLPTIPERNITTSVGLGLTLLLQIVSSIFLTIALMVIRGIV